MTRYTFGGDIHDLIARSDAAAMGALKVAPNTAIAFYAASTGGSPLSDYLVDSDGDGVFNQAATAVITRSTGYLPDFQGPDNLEILYYDPDPADDDVRRVRLVARDSGVGDSIPDASPSVKGVVRFPTAVELAEGSSEALATSVADVHVTVQEHANDSDPHFIYSDAISDLQAQMGTKVNGPVAVADLQGVSTAAQPDTLAQRTASGGLVIADAAADAEAVSLRQARVLSAFVAGADVRDVEATGLPLTLSTSAATWTTIPAVVVPDAASGQSWECALAVKYQAEAATGLAIRHKLGSSAETSLLANYNASFEAADLSSWTPSSNATFTRATAGGGFNGTAYGVLTATATGTLTLQSPLVPLGAVQTLAAGVYAQLGSGTARSVRIDIGYATDVNGSNSTYDLGSLAEQVTPTASWARVLNAASNPPVGATHARVRVSYLQPNVGESVHLDAVQLEPSSPIPAYGSTGGSGATALAVTGSYHGLALTAPTVESYTRRASIRTPTVAGTSGEFGGLGTTADADLWASLRFVVTGQGLQNQRLEFECAPRSAATTAPKIVSATATFARVL